MKNKIISLITGASLAGGAFLAALPIAAAQQYYSPVYYYNTQSSQYPQYYTPVRYIPGTQTYLNRDPAPVRYTDTTYDGGDLFFHDSGDRPLDSNNDGMSDFSRRGYTPSVTPVNVEYYYPVVEPTNVIYPVSTTDVVLYDGSEPKYAISLLRAFMTHENARVFPNVTYDGYGGAEFDMQAYFADTCFRYDSAIARVQGDCLLRFGPFANLRETFESGTLVDVIRRYADFRNVVSLVRDVEMVRSNLVVIPAGSITPVNVLFETGQREHDEMQRRSSLIWDACRNLYNYQYAPSAQCYSRNHRLMTDVTIPFNTDNTDNVY